MTDRNELVPDVYEIGLPSTAFLFRHTHASYAQFWSRWKNYKNEWDTNLFQLRWFIDPNQE